MGHGGRARQPRLATQPRLADLLTEKTDRLELAGPPPTGARSNLRVLEELGLLNPEVLWEMLGHNPVDPLHLIRIVRAHKEALGLVPEEVLVSGGSVGFFAGDKNEVGYKASLHIDVFTNDCVVISRREGSMVPAREIRAEALWDQLQTVDVGEERLKALLEVLRKSLTEALTDAVAT